MMQTGSKNLRSVVYVLAGVAITGLFVVFYLSVNQGKISQEIFGANNPSPPYVNATSFSSSRPVEKPGKVPRTEVVDETAARHSKEKSFEDLLPLLKRAAMDDNTIILTEVNSAWAAPNSLFDLFLESFRTGENTEYLLNHLVIVAMDQEAFERCKSVHPFCYHLRMEGKNFTSEKSYMSKGFIELVWSKVKIQQRIIEFGYNFLFTDMDIVWFRNPLERISVYTDIALSCDVYFGDPKNTINQPNTGLFYVKSTKKTAEMLKYWYQARKKYPKLNEQRVFNQIKDHLVNEMKVKMIFLDPKYLGGFCSNGKDLNKIHTMHANCCVGLGAKLNDLRIVIKDWRDYIVLPMEVRKNGVFTWRSEGICLH